MNKWGLATFELRKMGGERCGRNGKNRQDPQEIKKSKERKNLFHRERKKKKESRSQKRRRCKCKKAFLLFDKGNLAHADQWGFYRAPHR